MYYIYYCVVQVLRLNVELFRGWLVYQATALAQGAAKFMKTAMVRLLSYP